MSITADLEGRGRLILIKTPPATGVWAGAERAPQRDGGSSLMGEGAGREVLVGFQPPAAALATLEPGDPPWPRENVALGPLCLFQGKQKTFPR